MTCNETCHSIFYRYLSPKCIYLLIYVDDVVLTRNDHHDISHVEQHVRLGKTKGISGELINWFNKVKHMEYIIG